MDPNALATQISQLDSSYNPTDVYNKVTTQLGIPDARTRVQALQTQLVNSENALKQVDPSVTGRTSNSLVTEAQRQRLVNMERQPLAETYDAQGKQYGTEQSNLNDLTGQANTQIGLAADAYKNKRQSLADQLDFAQKQQAAAEAKAESDRAFAENQRQSNVTQATSRSNAAAKTAAPTIHDVAQHVVTQFNSLKGKDGKVSNETWQNALNDFTAMGGTPRQFWQNYGNYVNPKYAKSYAGYNVR